MFSRIRDRNVWLVYGAIFQVGIAYGISIALTALHLTARGFSKASVGALAACFALGIVLLSLPMGALIRRFSARATLCVSLLGYAVCVAAFPHMDSFAAIAGVRFFDGAFSVGIWVSCETILLSRAGEENKAFVTSLYAIAMALGYVLGPLAAKGIVAATSMPAAFMVSGVLATGAGLLVGTRLDPDVRELHAPAPVEATAKGASSRGLLWRIKTSCFATFAYGYFQASVVLFLPLFLIEKKGIPEADTILIPAFFAAGMLLFSSQVGRLGDRFGHLLVMRILAAIGTLMVASFVWLASWPLMCASIFVAGATLASISPVSLALQGVVAAPHEYARANAVYNAFYAAGMLLGPPASSAIFEGFGGGAMLGHLAVIWGAFVAFSMLFYRDDPAATRRLTLVVEPAPVDQDP